MMLPKISPNKLLDRDLACDFRRMGAGVLGIIFFTLGFAGVFPLSVHALSISPVRLELQGDPGTTIKNTLEIFNEQNGTQTFYISFENFDAQGETGTPHFVPGNDGLAGWLSAPSQVTLKAQERKIIPFSITIPKNTDAGGYFAAIFFGTAPVSQQGQQVSIGGKVGALILLSVSGQAKEGGGLLQFSIDQGSSFAASLPIVLSYRFSNDGVGLVMPKGTLEIKNLFGATAATLDANAGEGNVLPGSIRKFKLVWAGNEQDQAAVISQQLQPSGSGENQNFFSAAGSELHNFVLGPYRAQLNLAYSGKTVEKSFWFFVFPWQLLIVVLGIFAIIGFLAKMGIRRYNRWIIAKASGSEKK